MFAGLIDGEGCFTIGISPQHTSTLKFCLVFAISMEQGEWSAVASRVLEHHAIRFHTRRRKNQFEITVNSHKSVKNLIRILLPHLVVKQPLGEKLLSFPSARPRNRFSTVDRSYLDAVCEIVDYVRQFNKGKNRKHKWNGKTIRLFYENVARDGLSGTSPL